MGYSRLGHPALQYVPPFFTLAASDELADARHQDVHRPDGLSVVVHAHVEGLDSLGIVRDDHRLLYFLLGQVAFVLRLEISAPGDRVFKILARFLQQSHRLGVGDALELRVGDAFQGGDDAFIVPLVEEFHVFPAVLQHMSG